ncbi:MAG: hypothetical protein HOP19_13565, partial [Acidobacteria bacterium]|nr:hypothetical protein [Acidobacteriota bacterium]
MQKYFCWCLLTMLVLSVPSQAQKIDGAPAKPVPVAIAANNGLRNEDAKFKGAGITLAGTFTLPSTTTLGAAPKKLPAVLLLGAQGATPRDGMVVAPEVVQPIYKLLAEHLAAQGFVTFRFDKRCAGASGCSPSLALDDYVEDARAAFELLRARPEVNPAKVFVFGHDEG